MESRHSTFLILPLLGALCVVSPFSIDMYLTAYLQVAAEFGVATNVVALTLTAYFIGLAGGQLFYGPLLDRFGRKPPLAIGLLVFIGASLGCAAAQSAEMLIAMRFLQGAGGCGAQVAALAMVRDFFPPKQSARIMSAMFVFIAVSPLAAPSIGGLIVMQWGWRAVFFALMAIVSVILALVWFLLPEGHRPDRSISLRPGPIFAEYRAIGRNAAFTTYAVASAFCFSGLFVYVAGSPIVFMENFGLSAAAYSGLFAIMTGGFVFASQANILLLKAFSSRTLFAAAILVQAVVTVVFLAGTATGLFGLAATVAMFFLTLSCAGASAPNGAALALMPFTRNAGSASALLGFIQMTIGAVISSSISAGGPSGNLSIVAILAATSVLAALVLFIGRKRAERAPAEAG